MGNEHLPATRRPILPYRSHRDMENVMTPIDRLIEYTIYGAFFITIIVLMYKGTLFLAGVGL